MKILYYSLSLMVLPLFLYSCQLHNPSQADKTEAIIDSLIRVNRVNEKTLMVSFGSDAITAITTKKGVVVIDAGISTYLTQTFRTKIEEAFNSNNFLYVINTHAHHDHTGGNSVFPEAEIIGQVNGLKETEEQGNHPEKTKQRIQKIANDYDAKLQDCPKYSKEWIENFEQKTRYQKSYNDIANAIPVRKATFTFSDSLILDAGNVHFEMYYFGKCHSNSDILIYVPELKLLFTGDLMLPYGKPSINDKTMADKERWEMAVRWIQKRIPGINKVIGGHGQMLSVDDLLLFNDEILKRIGNE